MTPQDKLLLWEEKENCKLKPRTLPKLLLAVSYQDKNSVQIMHHMLDDWPLLPSVDALEVNEIK